MYYQTPYYLAPGKGGEKVYALLAETLRATRKVAVATFVMRGRQHLCVVMASDGTLVLITLRFADEILPSSKTVAGSKLKTAKLKDAEVSMARKLIEEMSAAFKPQQFRDTYREDLLKRINEKIKKKETHTLAVEPAKAERPKAEVIDLMDALKNSLKLRSKHGARATPKSAKGRRRA
jgi:DNA end-binding protein Ku